MGNLPREAIGYAVVALVFLWAIVNSSSCAPEGPGPAVHETMGGP